MILPLLQLIDVPQEYAGVLGWPLESQKYSLLPADSWDDVVHWYEKLPNEHCVLLTYAADAREAAQRKSQIATLREEFLCWNPVVLLQEEIVAGDDATRWALYRVTLPQIFPQLFAPIEAACPLSAERREAIVCGALSGLSEDLRNISRALASYDRIDFSGLYNRMQASRAALQADARAGASPELQNLKTALDETLALPSLSRAQAERLRDATVAGDNVARLDELKPLQDRLHKLNGELSQFLGATQDRSPLAHRIAVMLHRLARTGKENVKPYLNETLLRLQQQLTPPLEAVAASPTDETRRNLRAALDNLEDDLFDLQIAVSGATREGVSSRSCRVLLVEDSPLWQREIEAVLKDINVSYTTVSTVEAAQKWLENNKQPTLVLTDMGLPHDEAAAQREDTDWEAGLKLIEQYAGEARYQMVALTAHQDNPDLVRRSFARGLTPHDYLQKEPQSWEMLLRARVARALQPPRPDQALLEVLSYTGRTVVFNGVEVELDLPQFAVVEYLADAYPQACPVADMLAELGDGSTRHRRDILPKGHEVLDKQTHLQKYISAARTSLRETLKRAGRGGDYFDPIENDEANDSYRLSVPARVFDSAAARNVRRLNRSVLVVEDTSQWSKDIASELTLLGFQVRTASTTDGARAAIIDDPPELISLDLQLPATDEDLQAGRADEANALNLMRWLAAEYPQIRVAVLSAVAGRDRLMLELLREGIVPDDYLQKGPGAVTQLGQRLWRLSRELEFGGRIVEDAADGRPHRILPSPDEERDFEIDGHRIRLSALRARLLRRLCKNANQPVERDDLAEAMYGDEWPEDASNRISREIGHCGQFITAKTGGEVDGSELFVSAGKSYSIRAVVG